MGMRFLTQKTPVFWLLVWSLILKMTVKTGAFIGEADH